MQITTDQLFETIGRLHVENIYLNKMIAERNEELSILRTKFMEPKVDKDAEDR